jgi:hypothetical protein
MNTTEVVLVAAVVLLAVAFAAVAVMLVRMSDLLGAMRRDTAHLEERTEHLLVRLATATSDAEAAVAGARADLERFDRVLGSAESISGAMTSSSRVARTALSAPAIKAAGLATGTSKAVRRLRSRPVSLQPGRTPR